MQVVTSFTVQVGEVPLRRPFATSRDAVARTVATPVFLELGLSGGGVARGECVPVPYVTGETVPGSVNLLLRAAPGLVGADVGRPGEALSLVDPALAGAPSALAAVEMAIYDAYSQAGGVSLWRHFGGVLAEVETDVTISITNEAEAHARQAAAEGYRALKLKVGSPDPGDDVRRVVSVQRAAPDCWVRIDANQAFTARGALDLVSQLLDAGVRLQLVEQPVPAGDLGALDEVAAACPVPVFADEAVRTPAEALGVVQRTRVHGINVKVMKSGFRGALAIIAIARAAGRKLMMGCMLETRYGIAASLALAAGTGAFDFIDLDSWALLNEEGDNPWFTVALPYLRVRQ